MTRSPSAFGDLLRAYRRVTEFDVLDGAMFVLVSMGVIVALLQWGAV